MGVWWKTGTFKEEILGKKNHLYRDLVFLFFKEEVFGFIWKCILRGYLLPSAEFSIFQVFGMKVFLIQMSDMPSFFTAVLQRYVIMKIQ